MRTTVFAVILLLLQTVRAILDNVCASAHSTTVRNNFLDHANYLTITYFSATTDSNWSEGSFVREVEVYDPKTNGWQTGGEIPQPGAFAAAALFHDGRLWVAGGYIGPSSESISNATWIIAPIHTQP